VDLKEITGDALSHLLRQSLSNHGNKTAVLLLDMRPFVCYSVSSIKTAVCVCVPNVLLKRPMYSLGMLTEHLTTDHQVETFSSWRRFSNIILFDANGATPVKGSPLFCIAQKFRKEGFSARISYIQGRLSNTHPEPFLYSFVAVNFGWFLSTCLLSIILFCSNMYDLVLYEYLNERMNDHSIVR